MSPEKLAKTFGKHTDRRRFLSRAGTIGLGALGFFGLQAAFASPAQAWEGLGCHLCNPPTTSCGPALECAWCWQGNCVNGKKYNCCEGYRAGASCSGSCPAYCSWVTNQQNC